MKLKLIMVVRLATLTIMYFICFALVSALLVSPSSAQLAPVEPGATVVALLAVSFLNSMVLAYIILRSRWAGWKLILTIFFVLYGVVTVMTQIETAFFVTRLPPGMLPRLFLAGAVIAALFSTLAVLILGKGRPDRRTSDEIHSRLQMPVGEWVAKLSVIVIAYLILYFTFGYFIAWKSAAVRAYYGGNDPGSFVGQMRTVLRDMPLLLPLQAIRALLWTAIAVPVIRMMKGQWWEAGLAVALLFAVVMNSQLLLPNPYMPPEVRRVHLIETASSNFLFGWVIVLVLCGWRQAGREPA
ncbi:MAG TPA: hypothetical protein VGW76_13070 [Pyrinomonadaceae bacterium]|nr:hypothetical protein [Pyrinomonadaceae bacterium]